MGEVVLHSNGWRRSSLLPPCALERHDATLELAAGQSSEQLVTHRLSPQDGGYGSGWLLLCDALVGNRRVLSLIQLSPAFSISLQSVRHPLPRASVSAFFLRQ